MPAPGPFTKGSQTWPGTAKVIEEASELTQVFAKLMAMNGELAHWDGSNLRERMEEEIGDLLGAIEFFLRENCDVINRTAITKRKLAKLKLFEKWQAQQAECDHTWTEYDYSVNPAGTRQCTKCWARQYG